MNKDIQEELNSFESTIDWNGVKYCFCILKHPEDNEVYSVGYQALKENVHPIVEYCKNINEGLILLREKLVTLSFNNPSAS